MWRTRLGWVDSSGNVDEVSSSLELWVLNDSTRKGGGGYHTDNCIFNFNPSGQKTPAETSYESTEIGKKITELASIDDTREEEGQHNRLH